MSGLFNKNLTRAPKKTQKKTKPARLSYKKTPQKNTARPTYKKAPQKIPPLKT